MSADKGKWWHRQRQNDEKKQRAENEQDAKEQNANDQYRKSSSDDDPIPLDEKSESLSDFMPHFEIRYEDGES
jgi:hypothetical protein